jgi:hypothetical protein
VTGSALFNERTISRALVIVARGLFFVPELASLPSGATYNSTARAEVAVSIKPKISQLAIINVRLIKLPP